MQEKQRFAVALTGVGSCLVIAGGILLTTPRPSAPPAVTSRPLAYASELPQLPMTAWDDDDDVAMNAAAPASARVAAHEASRADASAAITTAPVPVPVAHMETPAAIDSRPVRVATLTAATFPHTLSAAPHAPSTDIVVVEERRSRGPVAAAFVTAGTHVGGSFKTVGRTVRRLF